jgi:hypothetical protein
LREGEEMNMRRRIRLASGLAMAALVAVSTTSAGAHGHGMPCAGKGTRMPSYDVATEVTFQGSVARIDQHHCSMMGRRGESGTHVVVETTDGEREVLLGPTAFLTERGFEFAKGDEVEITGSAIAWGGSHAVLAREVKKADQSLTLRDPAGRPMWGGGPRR